MTKLTRRGLLGASGGLLGMAACSEGGMVSTPEGRITISPDERPGYPGQVSFDHGVASGDPLPDRVIIWTRVTPDPNLGAASIPVSLG
ncbi:MAG: alkaline phosphatase, partial [Alphaproteobacteria bacterium]|nr:alkaline phosphatase [Alphaproteobacteria bacterium]